MYSSIPIFSLYRKIKIHNVCILIFFQHFAFNIKEKETGKQTSEYNSPIVIRNCFLLCIYKLFSYDTYPTIG